MPAEARRAAASALALVLLAPAGAPAGPATRIVVEGLPVYYQDQPSDYVSVRAYIRAGRSTAPAGREGLADLTAAWMLAGGSQSLAGAEFDAALDALGARMAFAASGELLVADLVVAAERLHPAVRLLADAILYPAFAPEREEEARTTAAAAPGPDPAVVEAREQLGIAAARPEPPASPLRRADVVAFHRERVGLDTTVLVLAGPLADVDVERQVRAAFLGFRRAAAPVRLAATHPAERAAASVAAHEVRPGRSRLLFARTTAPRGGPDWLASLVAILAAAPDGAATRVEQRLEEPDLVLFEQWVGSDAIEQRVAAAARRLQDARAGRLPARAFEAARDAVERLVVPPPDAPGAAYKHALLEALGGPGEDPALRLRTLRALDRASASRALARGPNG